MLLANICQQEHFSNLERRDMRWSGARRGREDDDGGGRQGAERGRGAEKRSEKDVSE